MSNPYVGEIRMFAGNFAPTNWAFCNGQLLPISQNEALFNLIGTTYGGDGQTTFALPNLQGRLPVHQGAGLVQGMVAGTEQVTLNAENVPNHTHAVHAVSLAGHSRTPEAAVPAGSGTVPVYSNAVPDVSLNGGAVGRTGAAAPLPHNNMQPFLCVNFIISLLGIFPSQG
jgi:microcystin-dependent protein